MKEKRTTTIPQMDIASESEMDLSYYRRRTTQLEAAVREHLATITARNRLALLSHQQCQ